MKFLIVCAIAVFAVPAVAKDIKTNKAPSASAGSSQSVQTSKSTSRQTTNNSFSDKAAQGAGKVSGGH